MRILRIKNNTIDISLSKEEFQLIHSLVMELHAGAETCIDRIEFETVSGIRNPEMVKKLLYRMYILEHTNHADDIDISLSEEELTLIRALAIELYARVCIELEEFEAIYGTQNQQMARELKSQLIHAHDSYRSFNKLS